ncbi:pectinesterase inhibitor 12-like [Vicia villosa]|uniref:pectinesterase inhibitor 12-like n=1 Tax=Vicia villosa TaxID=3911 RepID=UPI00273B8D27|nr:pectinesterase inhibitor 12-like [Vicia villosa]
MRFLTYIIISILFLSQYTNGSKSNLIVRSCREASKNDPNLSYDFCVTSLYESACKEKLHPKKLEDLVSMSIQLTKSNGTNIISIISHDLQNQTHGEYVKACLKDCFDLYNDSLESLDNAMVAFNTSKDLDTANINVSAALDDSVTCEDQFKERKEENETSPLTQENHVYFQLNVISLSFIQMIRQRY